MFGLKKTTPSPAPADPAPKDDLSALLDAFGRVLAAYGQGSFDLPGRPASETIDELDRWRLHVVLGVPLEDGEHRAASERDFAGAARAFSEHRRNERQFVESALADLRDALWTCVQRVHVAVQADTNADNSTTSQISRVQRAIQGLETGAVKGEVMEAISRIEQITQQRQATQREAYRSLAERIESMGTQLHVAVRESETDALTSLGNRKRYSVVAERAVQMFALQRAPVAIIMMDLDGLKAINDALGHGAGDAVIEAFSDCLHKVFLRDCDELCRIGGDEFVALLPNTTKALCARLATRLLDTVGGIVAPHGEAGPLLSVSVSVGYAEIQPGDDVATWTARADAAMYRAKAMGKARTDGLNASGIAEAA